MSRFNFLQRISFWLHIVSKFLRPCWKFQRVSISSEFVESSENEYDYCSRYVLCNCNDSNIEMKVQEARLNGMNE